jgi:TldD protein
MLPSATPLDTTDGLFFGQEGTHLDRATAERLVSETLAGADDGELFLEYRESEALSLEDGRIRTASSDTALGFGLRAVAGEATGYAHAGELSHDALSRAAESVRGHRRPAGDQPAPLQRRQPAALDGIRGPRGAAVGDRRLCAGTRSARHAGDGVDVWRVAGGADPARRWQPGGRSAAAGAAERLGGGGAERSARDRRPWHRRTLQLRLCARPRDLAGEMEVVLGAGWPGILLHEAIGHGLEGDFNRKKTSAFSGLLGQRIASPGVTVVDDGTLPDRRGSLTVDDEGTPTSRTVMIEDGILVGYIQDRMNARLMGMRATGNGRRQSYAHAPMPRMTNTIMLNGGHAPEEMIRSVKRGLYAVNFGGGQVDITSGKFVFSASEAYLIEDGKLGAPVKGATLIGNGPDALTKVTMVGNDMALDPGIGTCGKQGQGVPVGVGQPHMKMAGLTVGGTAG